MQTFTHSTAQTFHVRNSMKQFSRKPRAISDEFMMYCYLANTEEELELAIDQYSGSDLDWHHQECSETFNELDVHSLNYYEEDIIMSDETCPLDAPEDEFQEQQQLKSSWRKIQNVARKKGVKLYHFTDRSNIRIIKEQKGLYSWDSLERRGIQVPYPGGNDLSRRLDLGKNLHDYVRVCLHPNHPMKYIACKEGRIPNPTILEIDPEVLLWATTLYSNVNAAAGNANIGSTFTQFSQIDFDLCNSGKWTCEREKHYFQAEILIKKFLPIEFILNINDL
jgi:hypothetical protein